MITVGVAMIFLMIFRPEGILGKEKRKTIWCRWKRGRFCERSSHEP